MNALQEAIDRFPLVTWLQQHFRVRDTGREQLRIDCPICRGRRTLSVNCSTKQFHCFRCDDGGLGGSVWNGRANLFSFLIIAERLSPRAAADRIRTLSGVPDVPRAHLARTEERWPRGALALASVPSTHQSVRMLVDRGVGHLVRDAKVCVDGEFADRVLLPAKFFDEEIGFEAKTYVNAKPKSLLRYFTGSSGRVYTSRNWDTSKDFCVVTESILDAETLGVNAVGLFGSVLRDEQVLSLLKLRDIGVRRLVWFLDADALKKQNFAIRRKTGLFFDHYAVLTILSGEAEDPNSLGREACWDLVHHARPISDAFDLLVAA